MDDPNDISAVSIDRVSLGQLGDCFIPMTCMIVCTVTFTSAFTLALLMIDFVDSNM